MSFHHASASACKCRLEGKKILQILLFYRYQDKSRYHHPPPPVMQESSRFKCQMLRMDARPIVSLSHQKIHYSFPFIWKPPDWIAVLSNGRLIPITPIRASQPSTEVANPDESSHPINAGAGYVES